MKTTRYLSAILLLSIFALISQLSFGSHLSGADITYKHISGDTYEISLSLIRRCNGTAAPTFTPVLLTSTCGASFTINLQKEAGFSDITQLCNNQASDCNGGTIPGNEMHYYTGQVVLFPPCPGQWTMGWTSCCRPANPVVANISGANMTGFATLIDSLKPTSPFFDTAASHYPIQTVCAGTDASFNIAPIVRSNDSLVYLMDTVQNGLTVTNTPIFGTYMSGYSYNQPLPNWNLNPSTGQVTFSTYTSSGNIITGAYVATFRIEMYDKCTGIFKGHIQRDVQFIVVNGSCNAPKDSLGIQNFSGTAALLDSNSIAMCEGQNFSFDLTYTDTNSADTIDFRQQLSNSLPGAIITESAGHNPKTLTVTWTAPVGHPNFTTHRITISDGACPIPSTAVFMFDIQIAEKVDISSNTLSICAGQSAQLQATGALAYKWWKLDSTGTNKIPVVIGTDLSCDSCSNPIAYPSATTTFVVVGDTSSGNSQSCGSFNAQCISEDTVTIARIPDFTITAQGDTTLCNAGSDSAQFGVVIVDSVVSTYTYQWSNASTLLNNNVNNPVAIPLGTTQYMVTVTSNFGCQKTATTFVKFNAKVPTVGNKLGGDTLLCAGDTQQLVIKFGPTGPAICGPSNTGCNGLTNLGIIGNGSMSNPTTGVINSIATPFAGSVVSSRQQYIYKRSELINMGFNSSGGTLTELGFFVNNLGAANPTFDNYSIRIKCIPDTSLQAWEQVGFTQVFNPKTVNLSNGWNMMVFDTPYDWDGTSSIVVDMCFANSTVSSNVQVLYETVAGIQGANGVRYSLRNGFNGYACNTTNSIFAFTNANDRTRPNTRFRFCTGANPLNYSYSWSPLNGILTQDSNKYDPQIVSTGGGTKVFSVTISDTSGNCATTFVDSVQSTTQFDLSFTDNGPYCDNLVLSSLNPNTQGGTFSGTGILTPSVPNFSPTIAGIGIHPITHTISGNCGGTFTKNIEVQGSYDASFGNLVFCEISTADTMVGITAGGVWTGSLVTDTIFGIINPSLATMPGTYAVTHRFDSACFSTYTGNIIIAPQANGSIITPPGVCVNQPTIQLQGAVSGGTWSGNGIDTNGNFTAATVGVGTTTISYVVTGLGGCNDTGTAVVTINDTTNATITDLRDFCSADSNQVFTPVNGNGQWTPSTIFSNVNQGSVSPMQLFGQAGSGPHIFQHSITNAQGCTGIYTDTFEIFTPGSGNAACNTTTILTSELDEGGIQIMPNPSDGLITVVLPASDKSSEVSLIDISGKTLSSQVLVGAKSTLDFGDYPSGMYILQFENGSTMQSKRLILK